MGFVWKLNLLLVYKMQSEDSLTDGWKGWTKSWRETAESLRDGELKRWMESLRKERKFTRNKQSPQKILGDHNHSTWEVYYAQLELVSELSKARAQELRSFGDMLNDQLPPDLWRQMEYAGKRGPQFGYHCY